MAGTVTVIESARTREQTVGFGAKLIRWAWRSDVSGNADQASVYVYGGIVRALTTVPGVGGDIPAMNYNVAVNDMFGFDVLGGSGAMRKADMTQTVKDGKDFRYFAGTALTLVVTNAGNAKSGVVYVIILGL